MSYPLKCDHCGKQVASNPLVDSYGNARFKRLVWDGHSEPTLHDIYYDLCPACFDRTERFITGAWVQLADMVDAKHDTVHKPSTESRPGKSVKVDLTGVHPLYPSPEPESSDDGTDRNPEG